MQVYPDARLYKFKTVPSYHKLSVIYGDEVSNGRSSPTPYHLELDGEDPVLMIDMSNLKHGNL